MVRSISQKARGGSGKLVGIIVLLIFLVGGLVTAYFWSLGHYLEFRDSRNWVETPCTISSSAVGVHHGDGSTTYSIDITYGYTFEGTVYSSSRYNFIGGSSSGRAAKQAVVDQYPVGSESVCYVNPADPDKPVLNRDFTPGMFLYLIPLVPVLIGAGGLVGLAKAGKKSRAGSVYEERGIAASSTAAHDNIYAALPPGPTRLESKTSPRAKALGAGIILAAELIFAVIVFRIAHTKLVMIPFVVIGAALAAAFIYFFLACFNLIPSLNISSRAVSLGGAFELTWSFNGRVSAIHRLIIDLEGREEATYRRGTNTYTDKHVFATIPVVDTREPAGITGGSVGIPVPPDTMHSFSAHNNKIIWTLRFRGHIPNWPDVKQDFDITVLPLGIANS